MTHIHARPSATKTHLRNKHWYTAGVAPRHHRHSTKTPPNHDWHTTNTTRWTKTQHTHNPQHHETGDRPQAQCPDMTETPSKHHDDTHSPTWAPHSAMPTQKRPRWAKMKPKQPNMNMNPIFLQVKNSLSNFHFHTLFIHGKFPLMPLAMLCMSACAAPWNRIN